MPSISGIASSSRSTSTPDGAATLGTVGDATRIQWTRYRSAGTEVGTPDPERWAPLGFPAPPPDRPWIFGVVVVSANGVVAWRRRDARDDPVREILGDETRLDRRADRRLMRYLRTIGDVGIGAQTVREQPTLILSPQEPGDERAPELYAFRVARGLSHHPRNIIYSLYGRVPPQHPMLTTPGLSTIILTTPAGRAELTRRGIRDAAVIVEPLLEPGGLARAHARLRAEHGVRYIACEGGQTLFGALRAARLLDEVFLTTTDVLVDRAAHEGVLTTFDFAAEGATLVAEGRLEPAGVYTFKRWRFGGTRR
jgi:riboflavin biosynthesis pyrimidine reductase